MTIFLWAEFHKLIVAEERSMLILMKIVTIGKPLTSSLHIPMKTSQSVISQIGV